MFAGLNRDGMIEQIRTLFFAAALMIASHFASVISSGFSTTTCLPALHAFTAGSP